MAYKSAVTICISAIADNGIIIGAADTMMTDTWRGVEFELKPSSAGKSFVNKVSPITDGIVVLTAGAATLQAEIIWEMIMCGQKQQGAKWQVKEAVELYCNFYGQIKRNKINKSILNPIGLTVESFAARQKELDSDFIQTIAHKIWGFEMETTETIIAGIDDDGSHIYVLHGDHYQCCDMIGFCAVGSGSSHAESQFMLAGYNRLFNQEDAFWLTYLAKRKSEIAPGVGRETIFFAIDPKSRKAKLLNPILNLDELEKHYAAFEAGQKEAFVKANASFKQHLESIKDAR